MGPPANPMHAVLALVAWRRPASQEGSQLLITLDTHTFPESYEVMLWRKSHDANGGFGDVCRE